MTVYELGQQTIKHHGTCCKELGLPVRIETPIESAPSYREYIKVCKQYVKAIKARNLL